VWLVVVLGVRYCSYLGGWGGGGSRVGKSSGFVMHKGIPIAIVGQTLQDIKPVKQYVQ
jgi:hypothetical protein